MSDKKIYFLKPDNTDVVDFYFSIVEKAFLGNNWNVIYLKDFSEAKKCNKNSYLFITDIKPAIVLVLCGFRNVIYWFQGISPEEDFLRRRSYIRMYVLKLCEYIILHRAKLLLFVSEYMKEHYMKFTKLNFKYNSFVMPCFNTTICADAFLPCDKYLKNVFCYVGSLDVWQSFDKTLLFYKKVEAMDRNSLLKVFTRDVQNAEKRIIKAGIENFEVRYVPQHDLPKELSECKYGFILREDNKVNNVATPTKMSTYLSCGLIPVYSSCLKDFSKNFASCNFFVPVDDFSTENIERVLRHEVKKADVFREYQYVFDTYYDADAYILKLRKLIDKML